jgi:hypothetical protein
MSYSKVYLMIIPNNDFQSNYEPLYEPMRTFNPLQVINQNSNLLNNYTTIPFKMKFYQKVQRKISSLFSSLFNF